MMSENQELQKRFDRIETKIDKLSDAMISLARTEEKIMAMESDRTNMIERLNRHSEKIDELNDLVKENNRVVSNIVKLTWLIGSALIMALATMYFGGMYR